MTVPFDVNEKVENNRSGVYAIVNIKTEKFYIGSAVKFKTRKNEHFNDLRKQEHHSKYLQRSYNKHGSDVFVFIVLEYVEDKNNLLKVEQKYLDIYFPTGVTYNICPTAGSNLGRKWTEESKKRMSKAQKGRKHSEETKKKMGEWHKNRKHSEESKNKMSLVKQNQSVETRRKISEAHKCKSRERWFKPILQFTKNNEFVKRYNSMIEASKETGANRSDISSCCSGKLKSSGGFIWKYEQQ